MSTHRCDHGTVISDQCGEYRCLQCDPIDEEDHESLKEAAREALEALEPFTQVPSEDAPCHRGICEQIECSNCQRHQAALDAHIALSALGL